MFLSKNPFITDQREGLPVRACPARVCVLLLRAHQLYVVIPMHRVSDSGFFFIAEARVKLSRSDMGNKLYCSVGNATAVMFSHIGAGLSMTLRSWETPPVGST